MNNIERLLDACLKQNGEKLVLNLGEPPYVVKNKQKQFLMQKDLTVEILQYFAQEVNATFAAAKVFLFQGHTLALEKGGNRMTFTVAPKTPASAGLTVPQSIEQMLTLMMERHASDIHLATKCKPTLRIDGDIVPLKEYAEVDEAWLWAELQKIAPSRNITEFEHTHDTDFAYEFEGQARFRVNNFRDHRGIGVVLRQIPTTVLSASQLNVPAAVIELCNMPKGLVLVTGPTGSGKSTTLAALIDHINRTQQKHIITIEDPVEFVHKNSFSLINQRELNTHTESFKKGLRAALREDPDVVLVGEMRDLETIAIAIEMAVTGHLVFGTLHTASACGTVDRIIDQFPSTQQDQIRTMLADALIGVVSQMLCKKKGGGRIAAYEVLIVSAAISNMIREGKIFQIPTLMQTGKALGMKMMNDSLAELVEKGAIDAIEALSKAVDKDNLKTRLKMKGVMPPD